MICCTKCGSGRVALRADGGLLCLDCGTWMPHRVEAAPDRCGACGGEDLAVQVDGGARRMWYVCRTCGRRVRELAGEEVRAVASGRSARDKKRRR